MCAIGKLFAANSHLRNQDRGHVFVYAANGIPKRNRLPHLRIQATLNLPFDRLSLLLEKARLHQQSLQHKHVMWLQIPFQSGL